MSWATPYIAALQRGETVEFRPRGNSMVPLIHSGDLCRVVPLDGRALAKGDIVLCKVMGKQYLHLVSATRGGQVQISNNQGRINGWCTREHIYGLLER